MKSRGHHFEFLGLNFKLGNLKFFFAFAFLFFALVIGRGADKPLLGHSTDFVSNQYFEPPNQQKVKVRISGTSATPTADNKAMVITDLRIERFKLTGETEVTITAPQCTYSFDGVANSAGHLEFETGDGKMKTTGDGFLWRQSDNSLTISNNVCTLLQMNALKISVP
jgi:hypothetical protein